MPRSAFLPRTLVPLLALGAGFSCTTAPAPHVGAKVDLTHVETVHPALPTIPQRTFSLANYGAVGDGKTMNTDAFNKAIAAVQAAGGGKLVVPPGVYVTAPFKLCSSLDFHLDEGAVIKAPETFEALGLPDPAQFKTQEEADKVFHVPDPLITADKVHDLAITGPGKIDGSGQHWWDWSERAGRATAVKNPDAPARVVYRRPHLVVITGCERLHVADITLTNSSMFHLVPRNVSDLTIERVKVRAPFNAPNTDAIDPGPVDRAWIHHCDIDTGDDDIVIKTGCNDTLIEDCTIKHGHGISVGSPTMGGVHNLLVRHCTFDGADNGIRLKSMRGAGGPTENVRYTDITMHNVANAIILQLDYVDNNRPNFTGDPKLVPSIQHIKLDHLTITGSRNAGIIHGIPDSTIKDIELSDITVEAEKDFDVKYADDPMYINVVRNIKPGVGPKRAAGEH